MVLNMIPVKLIYLVLTLIELIVTINCSSITHVDYTPEVKTKYGPIRGRIVSYNGTKVYQFLGIPFATPPVGPNRFMKPKEPEGWTAVRDVVNHGNQCIQKIPEWLETENFDDDKQSEDCLYLDVTLTEATFRSKMASPVMFWIHGGSFMYGSGSEPIFTGLPLVVGQDVILVSINYRLNVFGFLFEGDRLPSIPGNMGLWDQLMALHWVKDNIGSFGGNPEMVTLFGVSAGAFSVSGFLISPQAKGLFRRGIIQSGIISMVDVNSRGNVQQSTNMLLEEIGCSGSTEVELLKCLQSAEPKDLIDSPSIVTLGPIFGDSLLPIAPWKAFTQPDHILTPVDLLIGTTDDESSLFLMILDKNTFNPVSPQKLTIKEGTEYLEQIFAFQGLNHSMVKAYFDDGQSTATSDNEADKVRKVLVKATTDIFLLCPTFMTAHTLANNHFIPVTIYGYYLTQKPLRSHYTLCAKSTWSGTCHLDDIQFVFGLPLIHPKQFNPNDTTLSHQIIEIWTSFARDGHPKWLNQKVDWPKFQSDDLPLMVLNSNQPNGLINKERAAFCLNHKDEIRSGSNLSS